MKNEYKRIVLNCLYAVVLFSAIMGTVSLIVNAVDLLAFKVPGYDFDYAKYIITLTGIAALVSSIGITLFIISFFVKRNNTALIAFEVIIIISLLVLTAICAIGIGIRDDGVVYSTSFILFTGTQEIFIQPLITFILLLITGCCQKYDGQKIAATENTGNNS